MSSIVLELQRDALNQDVSVSSLLRKALVVAKKLKVKVFEHWISLEMNGYDNNDQMPEYRKFTGEVRGLNPFHGGWVPMIFGDGEMAAKLSSRLCGQSVAELEHLMDGGKGMHMPFSTEIDRILSKGNSFETKFALFIPSTVVLHALESVRSIILNWALKLEEDGILGEGVSFTAEEKGEVGKHSYNINNFYGPVGGSTIQQGTDKSLQVSVSPEIKIDSVKVFLSQLKNSQKNLGLNSEAKMELEAEIETLEAQTNSPKPKSNIIKEGLKSIRSILEGAAGGVAAELLKELGKWMF